MNTNWDIQKSKDLLENNETAIMAMKVLQSYISSLSKLSQISISECRHLTLSTGRNQLIGRKASDVYEDGKPETVQLTLSSLMFDKMENGGDVKDFFQF